MLGGGVSVFLCFVSLCSQVSDIEQRAQDAAQKVRELTDQLRHVEHELEHQKTLPIDERLSLNSLIRQLRIELAEEKRVRTQEEEKLAAERAALIEATDKQQALQQEVNTARETVAEIEQQLHKYSVDVARMDRVTTVCASKYRSFFWGGGAGGEFKREFKRERECVCNSVPRTPIHTLCCSTCSASDRHHGEGCRSGQGGLLAS
jgi:hypothetical protein